MKIVKESIKDYGFNTEEIKNDKVIGYHCINKDSNTEFILDFTSNNYKCVDMISDNYSKLMDRDLKIVYLIEVNENIDEIISFLENDSTNDELFLIYDKDDEIEFFLKDLWNTILVLKNNK